MSDQDFIDVGDELVVRISGYPLPHKAKVIEVTKGAVYVEFCGYEPNERIVIALPLDVKSYDTVDGVAHTAIAEHVTMTAKTREGINESDSLENGQI